jgi:hypothetical protein
MCATTRSVCWPSDSATCRGSPWACREGNGPRPPFGGSTPLSLRAPLASTTDRHCERAANGRHIAGRSNPGRTPPVWIASGYTLAMTAVEALGRVVRGTAPGPPSGGARPCHCEPPSPPRQVVIASEAKQSRGERPSSGLLRRFASRNDGPVMFPAMTMPPVIASGPLVRAGEAIPCEGLPRLDCFVASLLAMTAFSLFNSPLSIRAPRAHGRAFRVY